MSFQFPNADFVSENVFLSDRPICVLVVEERSVLGIYSFTFGTPLSSGILRSGSTKCRFYPRKPFYIRKRFVFRDLGGRCVPVHRKPIALRAEYCIVGIQHNTSI